MRWDALVQISKYSLPLSNLYYHNCLFSYIFYVNAATTSALLTNVSSSMNKSLIHCRWATSSHEMNEQLVMLLTKAPHTSLFGILWYSFNQCLLLHEVMGAYFTFTFLFPIPSASVHNLSPACWDMTYKSIPTSSVSYCCLSLQIIAYMSLRLTRAYKRLRNSTRACFHWH